MTDHVKSNDKTTPLTSAPGDPHWSKPKHSQQEILQGYDYHDPTGLQKGGYEQGGALTMFGKVGFSAKDLKINTAHGTVYEIELIRRYGTQGEWDFIIEASYPESTGLVGDFRTGVEHGFDVCQVDLDLATLNDTVTALEDGSFRVRFKDGEAKKIIQAIVPYRTAVRTYQAIPLQQTVTYWVKEAAHVYAGLDELEHGKDVFGTTSGGSWLTDEVSYANDIVSHWTETINKYIMPAYNMTEPTMFSIKYLQLLGTPNEYHNAANRSGSSNSLVDSNDVVANERYVAGWYVDDTDNNGWTISSTWRLPTSAPDDSNYTDQFVPAISFGDLAGVGSINAQNTSWVYRNGVPTNKDSCGDLRHDVESLKTLSNQLTQTKNITNRVQQHNVQYQVLSLPLPKAFVSDDTGIPESQTWIDTHPVWDYIGLPYTVANSYDTIAFTRMYAARHNQWQSTNPDANTSMIGRSKLGTAALEFSKPELYNLLWSSAAYWQSPIPSQAVFPHLMYIHAGNSNVTNVYSPSGWLRYETLFDRQLKKDMQDEAISSYWVNIHNWSADNKENWVYRPPPSPVPKELPVFYNTNEEPFTNGRYTETSLPFYSDMWRAPKGIKNRVSLAYENNQLTPGLVAKLPKMNPHVPGVWHGWLNTNNWYFSASISEFDFPALPSYNAIFTNSDPTWVNQFDFKYGNRFHTGYSSYKRDATVHFNKTDFWDGEYDDFNNPEQGEIHTFGKKPTVIRLDDTTEQVMFRHVGVKSTDPGLTLGLSACSDLSITDPITARVDGMKMNQADSEMQYVLGKRYHLVGSAAGGEHGNRIITDKKHLGYLYNVPAANCVIKNYTVGTPEITYDTYNKLGSRRGDYGASYIHFYQSLDNVIGFDQSPDLSDPVLNTRIGKWDEQRYTWAHPLPTDKTLLSVLPARYIDPTKSNEYNTDKGFQAESVPSSIPGYWEPQTFMKSFSEKHFDGDLSRWVNKDDSLTGQVDGPGEEGSSYVLYDLSSLSHAVEEWADNDKLTGYYKCCVDHLDREIYLSIRKFNEDDPVEVDGDYNESEMFISKAPMYEVAAHATYDDNVNLKNQMNPVKIYSGYQSWNDEPSAEPLVQQIFTKEGALSGSQVQYLSLAPGQLGGGTTPVSTQPGARPLKAGTLSITPNLFTTTYTDDFEVRYGVPRASTNYSQTRLRLKNTGEKPLKLTFPERGAGSQDYIIEGKTKYEVTKDATTGAITSERGDKVQDWQVQIDWAGLTNNGNTVELQGGESFNVSLFLKEVTVGMDITSYNLTLPINVNNNGITTTRRVTFDISLTS